MLEPVAAAMLRAQANQREEYDKLHRQLLGLVRDDAVCRRLMTTPGVGPVVAMTYKAAIDEPERFHKSKDVGRYFG
jgi:transposase